MLNKITRIKKYLIVPIIGAALILFAGVVYAATSYRINNGTAQVSGNEWSSCRNITNSSGRDLFVPTNTLNEWNAFVNTAVGGVTKTAGSNWYYDGDGDGYYPTSPAAQQACSSPGGGWTTTEPSGATSFWNTYGVWLYGGDSTCNGGAHTGTYQTGTKYFGAYYGGVEPFHMGLVYSRDFWGVYANPPASCLYDGPSFGQYYIANTYGPIESNAADCNDGNAGIKPSASEVCNGADDNCNGQTDEGSVCCTSHAYTYCPVIGQGVHWYDSCGNQQETSDGCPGNLYRCADANTLMRTSGGCSGGDNGCLEDAPVNCPYGCAGSNPNAYCNNPPPQTCGNSVVEGSETCDSNSQGCGNGGTQTCNGSCNGWNSCQGEYSGCYDGYGGYYNHGDYMSESYEDNMWWGGGNCYYSYGTIQCNNGNWDGYWGYGSPYPYCNYYY